MKLGQLKAENTGSLPKANFIDWKKNPRVRLVGDIVRRQLHFIEVEKTTGTSVTIVIPCINYDYSGSTILRIDGKCPIDEVYDLQLKGEKHSDLGFCSFKQPPPSWGKDATPSRATFQASINCIDRIAQKSSLPAEELMGIIRFRKSPFNELVEMATPPSESDPNADFLSESYRGDPSDDKSGYDLLLKYHPDRFGGQKFEIIAGKNESPLSPEESDLVKNNSINLEDYYRIRTRDEIIEYLTGVHEDRGSQNGNGFNNNDSNSSSFDNVSADLKKMMQDKISSDSASDDSPF